MTGALLLGKPSPGTANTTPPSHLVPNVFPQLSQDPVEESQLRDQCLGLLACQEQKGQGQPQDRRSLPGLWAGTALPPLREDETANDPSSSSLVLAGPLPL